MLFVFEAHEDQRSYTVRDTKPTSHSIGIEQTKRTTFSSVGETMFISFCIHRQAATFIKY